MGLSGRLTNYNIQRHHFNEHKYLGPPLPFVGENSADIEDTLKIAPNVTDNEVDSIFRNPWHWLTVSAIPVDPDLLLESYKTDNRIWPRKPGVLDHMWLLCFSTGQCILHMFRSGLFVPFLVWDVTYTAVGREIIELEATKSNGTIAGIASMSVFPVDFFASHASLAVNGAANESTPDGYIASQSRAISKMYTHSLVA